MKRVRVASAITCACRFTSTYVSRLNDDEPPGRWQLAQFAKTMGAMSFVNVTTRCCAANRREPLPATSTMTATRTSRARFNGLLRRHAEQPAGIRVLEHPHGAVWSDFDVANAVTDTPAFGGRGSAFTVGRDAAERLRHHPAHQC